MNPRTRLSFASNLRFSCTWCFRLSLTWKKFLPLHGCWRKSHSRALFGWFGAFVLFSFGIKRKQNGVRNGSFIYANWALSPLCSQAQAVNGPSNVIEMWRIGAAQTQSSIEKVTNKRSPTQILWLCTQMWFTRRILSPGIYGARFRESESLSLADAILSIPFFFIQSKTYTNNTKNCCIHRGLSHTRICYGRHVYFKRIHANERNKRTESISFALRWNALPSTERTTERKTTITHVKNVEEEKKE